MNNPIDGIEARLRQLALPYCVASSGSHEKMKMTLGRTGLYHYFAGKIFSTSEVERGKPHPDIYLHAAAGMHVFGFAELMPTHKLEASGAHLVFEHTHNLPDVAFGGYFGKGGLMR